MVSKGILNLCFTYRIVLHVPPLPLEFGEKEVGGSCWLWTPLYQSWKLMGLCVSKSFESENGSGRLYVDLQSNRLEGFGKIAEYVSINNEEPGSRHAGTYSQQLMKWELFSWVGGSLGWIQSLNALMPWGGENALQSMLVQVCLGISEDWWR